MHALFCPCSWSLGFAWGNLVLYALGVTFLSGSGLWGGLPTLRGAARLWPQYKPLANCTYRLGPVSAFQLSSSMIATALSVPQPQTLGTNLAPVHRSVPRTSDGRGKPQASVLAGAQ